ncbi:MAG: DUF488 domain-containing protein [Aestuariivita sp.]|nr:DUF488 domain-containing protein [Aestuariivita sp.]MCY4201499.1 DUF488 domain-containing protein [Aestuariivita sp.]
MTKKTTFYYRQRVMLSLLEEFGGRLNRIDFQKYLFLFTERYQTIKSYEFVPFKYGCFSFQSYADRRKLVELGVLKDVDEWEISDGTQFRATIKSGDWASIQRFRQEFGTIKGNDLVREVYVRYPYFALRSEIKSSVLSDRELARVEAVRPVFDTPCLFSIGYEGRSFENYLNKLIKNNIRIVVDVRKNPLSRKYGFSKKTLSETLRKLDIQYQHFPELGIQSEKRQSLKTQDDYEHLFEEFEQTVLTHEAASIRKLFDLFCQFRRIAITCFEADVCMCHRSRVIKALEMLPEWTHSVEHI